MEGDYFKVSPCPNCGQEDNYDYGGARVFNPAWGHTYFCCSERCGRAYAKKLKAIQKVAHTSAPTSVHTK